MSQDIRDFLTELEKADKSEILHVHETLSRNCEPAELIFELDKQKRFPVVMFHSIEGSVIPVVANILASRKRLAFALGVAEDEFAEVFSERSKNSFTPVVKDNPPFMYKTFTGDDIDLTKLPVFRHTPIDGGEYITAGMTIAKDPDLGVETCGYHRLQVKEKNRLAISLHSRRRMWDYLQRSEKKGKNLEAAIVLGIHPLFTMGCQILVPYDESKFSKTGALFNEPVELAQCPNIDVKVPYWAEVVIEGEILAGVHEPEGPFAEFTGFSCDRSTNNVFVPKAVHMRENPTFQTIIGGMSAEHTTILAVPREGDMLRFLREKLPMVSKVHVPYSGCGFFHCYISMKKTAEGQPLQAIMLALSMDHNCKLVVVVDDEVDVFDESKVLWSISTKVQADKRIVILPQHMGMGCTLDPSSDENSQSSKMGIDATLPLVGFSTSIPTNQEARAKMKKLLSEIL